MEKRVSTCVIAKYRSTTIQVAVTNIPMKLKPKLNYYID